MNSDNVLYFAKSTVSFVYALSMPIIIAATAVGLLVALLQALIQVQDQTLGFAVKLVAVIYVASISAGWMSTELLNFFDLIFNSVRNDL